MVADFVFVGCWSVKHAVYFTSYILDVNLLNIRVRMRIITGRGTVIFLLLSLS